MHGGHQTMCSLQLDAMKVLHQGEALWTALQFQPPAGDSTAPLAQQQLRAAQMELLLTEQRARNSVKGFWKALLHAMEVQMMLAAHMLSTAQFTCAMH